MKVTRSDKSVTQLEADALVVVAGEPSELTGPAAEVNQATDGMLARALEWEQYKGKPGEIAVLPAPPNVAAGAVVAWGLGDAEEAGRGEVFRGLSAAVRRVSDRERPRLACSLPAGWSAAWQETAVAAAVCACRGQDLYREEAKRHPFNEVVFSGVDQSSLDAGVILGESIALTRRLVNEPAAEIYPESFAEKATEVAQRSGLKIEVWGQPELERERCGSLLAVARGSSRPPRLVILRYRGADAGAPTLALVGKGVTFDSGGLSLKPSDGMKTMKCDMAGGATVLGAMQAIGQLKLKANVVGVIGLVENMVSGDSYKLGDVLTARNGTTIEVLNTDAEGRLVLADALDVAVSEGAHHIIDLATLTGACMVALGRDVAGLMSNDQPWCDRVAAAARECGEPVWQLPMYSDYDEQIASPVADIKNIGDGRWGGAITAAKLLERFVSEKPWTHIDIAGPSFVETTKSWIDGGGSGAYVRTLVEIARQWND